MARRESRTQLAGPWTATAGSQAAAALAATRPRQATHIPNTAQMVDRCQEARSAIDGMLALVNFDLSPLRTIRNISISGSLAR